MLIFICNFRVKMSKKVPTNQNDKRGYRTASEYAAQAAARIQINENGFIDIVSCPVIPGTSQNDCFYSFVTYNFEPLVKRYF